MEMFDDYFTVLIQCLRFTSTRKYKCPLEVDQEKPERVPRYQCSQELDPGNVFSLPAIVLLQFLLGRESKSESADSSLLSC